MTQVVLVHGIFNYVPNATPEQAAATKVAGCQPKLADSLARLSVKVPKVEMAYYADLLRPELPEQAQSAWDDAVFEGLSPAKQAEVAEWLITAGATMPEDPQNVGLAPLRQMLGWVVDKRGGGRLSAALREQTIGLLERAIVVNSREVEAYTAWPDRRRKVRARVEKVIRREKPAVVIAHSLGSYVAYETLCASELEVELFVTVGSPLAIPSLARRLDPALRAGRGARPAGVQRWVNIADVGDVVAIPPKLGEMFPVDADETCDNGVGFHGFGGYLANGLVAACIAPYLS
ncbi:hypothetical protein ACWEQL_21710 [Kitasatospora sp. NPDC004240]